MRYLLVIDMQEDYVGTERNRKRYPYDAEALIHNINNRIKEYPPEAVIYITNKFFWEIGSSQKPLVEGLTVVSRHIFVKRRQNAFSNPELLKFLQTSKITSLELVGVDGNYCVGSTALNGVKNGFQIVWNESCIGIGNKARFTKMKASLKKNEVNFIHDV